MNTRDLMDFGLRELKQAAKLLSLLKTGQDHTLRLGDKVTPEFNPESSLVFLVDDNFNVAMISNGNLEDWLLCPQCHTEGFRQDLENEAAKACCRLYAKAELSAA